MDEVKKELENAIKKKLAQDEISCADIFELCKAFNELYKNDWMQEMVKMPFSAFGNGGFGMGMMPRSPMEDGFRFTDEDDEVKS